MKISLIQTDIAWEKPDSNLTHFESILSRVDEDSELVVLPEMFPMGFSMNPASFPDDKLAEIPVWMKYMADKGGFGVMGSSIAAGANGHYNRLYFTLPGERVEFYDKRHLFRMGEEQNHYLPGQERKVFYYKGWRICPQVCYDLRFPVWSRNRNDYDLLVYVANWPAARQDAWDTLLKARAIENQCFVVGVNRTGADPRVSYAGGSVVFSPKGEVLSQASPKHSDIFTATIDLDELRTYREKFPAWMDADDFTIH